MLRSGLAPAVAFAPSHAPETNETTVNVIGPPMRRMAALRNPRNLRPLVKPARRWSRVHRRRYRSSHLEVMVAKRFGAVGRKDIAAVGWRCTPNGTSIRRDDGRAVGSEAVIVALFASSITRKRAASDTGL